MYLESTKVFRERENSQRQKAFSNMFLNSTLK